MAKIKATLFFDKRYWVGIFERTDKEGFSVARHIFGTEPTDPQVYEFVLTHYQELKFGLPQEFNLEIKRMNPKRVQKEVRREMERIKETAIPSTFAQDYMREELEKKKLHKKQQSRAEKQAHQEEQHMIRQRKKKEKQKGH